MEYISSDTNIWLDFAIIGHLELPFRLPYTYLMNVDAVHDELLAPPELGKRLLLLGLVEIELTEEEFFLAEEYVEHYVKLSVYDSVALSIAKCRNIVLMTGDGALRKAAQMENVPVMGTIGVLDQLYQREYIEKEVYLECLLRLQEFNGGKVRLPAKEIGRRIEEIKADYNT